VRVIDLLSRKIDPAKINSPYVRNEVTALLANSCKSQAPQKERPGARLIIHWSQVQILEGPPSMPEVDEALAMKYSLDRTDESAEPIRKE
jgi:hypothetical protein